LTLTSTARPLICRAAAANCGAISTAPCPQP
jgi:hypothetical protein